MHDNLRQEVERISSAYVESFNRQDAAGIAALYTDDGVHTNSAGPRTDIKEFYRGLLVPSGMRLEFGVAYSPVT